MVTLHDNKPITTEAPYVLEEHIKRLELEVKSRDDEKGLVKEHIRRFDELDFDVFSKQRWDLLDRSHTEDVRVIWPDGHETYGIAQHSEDLKAMFISMPDLHITSHPVSFGSGEWTAAIGVMEGTFSKPMTIPGGHVIAPNGKRINVRMTTIAHWREGRIYEEYLSWDSAAFSKQLGLEK